MNCPVCDKEMAHKHVANYFSYDVYKCDDKCYQCNSVQDGIFDEKLFIDDDYYLHKKSKYSNAYILRHPDCLVYSYKNYNINLRDKKQIDKAIKEFRQYMKLLMFQ